MVAALTFLAFILAPSVGPKYVTPAEQPRMVSSDPN